MRLKEYINETVEKYLYFGHPRLYYNTKEENKAIQMISNKFRNHLIVNPNQKRYQKNSNKMGFKIFNILVDRCDIGVFMLMKDGTWGAGIYKEAQRMESQGKKIFEVNPRKNFIKLTTTKNIIPLGKDSWYYKKFKYDSE
jgi:hypothetical protein